ncbi:MAG: hypothetical protein HY843_05755, partial [Bdellovibrio sp.]|nr:hypothetical protein [Bdellovibrio sp.]
NISFTVIVLIFASVAFAGDTKGTSSLLSDSISFFKQMDTGDLSLKNKAYFFQGLEALQSLQVKFVENRTLFSATVYSVMRIDDTWAQTCADANTRSKFDAQKECYNAGFKNCDVINTISKPKTRDIIEDLRDDRICESHTVVAGL